MMLDQARQGWTRRPSKKMSPESWFNVKMLSLQDKKFHCRDKTVVQSSYLHNRISYTGEMSYLYWSRVQAV